MTRFEDDKFFEDEVRRIARQLWPEDRYSGSATLLGRERDGVFVTEDIVNIVEATTSRKKEKAIHDVTKIVDLAKDLRKIHQDKVMKGWLVTSHEPEVEQRAAAQKHTKDVKIVVCSFETFRSRLIDAGSYLDLRQRYRFGSIINLENPQAPLDREDYVQLEVVELNRNEDFSLAEITDSMQNKGSRFLLLGDYGAGKSMTLREIFFKLREAYIKKKSEKFPVYVNLRDHHGQKDPDEVLARHASLIGLQNKEQLVRAWRAGYVDLLLDGFDELATAGWLGITKKLKQIRFQTMEVMREFVRQSPINVGLLIAGRKHYFDTDNEMRSALGSNGIAELSLSDFTDEQIRSFFEKKGAQGNIPDWLPSRPLLIGYLIAHKIVFDGEASQLPAAPPEGWNYLFSQICEREARIAADIEPEAVQHIIERLATVCRSNGDGLGPLYADDLSRTFQEVMGFLPDDRGQMLLMRLPGLGPTASDDGSRRFIDSDLADVARAGDVCRFITDPFNFPLRLLEAPEVALGWIGTSVAALRCRAMHYTDQKLSLALSQASRFNNTSILCVDVVNVMVNGGWNYIGEPTVVRDVLLEGFWLMEGSPDMSKVSFQDSLVGKVEIDPEIVPEVQPRFYGCLFDVVEGRVSVNDLPAGVFNAGCTFGEFSDVRTNAEIFALRLPEPTKVLLTILKKLFMQKGSGRQEAALSRGMDHRARRLVKDVLGLIQSEKFAVRTRLRDQTIWLPSRDQSRRAKQILAAPSSSNDPVVLRCAELE